MYRQQLTEDLRHKQRYTFDANCTPLVAAVSCSLFEALRKLLMEAEQFTVKSEVKRT
ncbi:MAG: hypothetical protein ACK4I8_05875 [Armatimonadota bacterium]